MAKFKSIQVNDLVSKDSRSWLVVGCYVGALGYETVIELVALDQQQNGDEPLRVPLDLIPHTAIYRGVDHEAAKAGA